MEKELKEAEDYYIKKESVKKSLKEMKHNTELQGSQYEEELRKLRKLIEQDKKNGILDDPSKN